MDQRAVAVNAPGGGLVGAGARLVQRGDRFARRAQEVRGVDRGARRVAEGLQRVHGLAHGGEKVGAYRQAGEGGRFARGFAHRAPGAGSYHRPSANDQSGKIARIMPSWLTTLLAPLAVALLASTAAQAQRGETPARCFATIEPASPVTADGPATIAFRIQAAGEGLARGDTVEIRFLSARRSRRRTGPRRFRTATCRAAPSPRDR